MFKKEKIKDLHYSVNGFLSSDEIQVAADEILTEYGKKVTMPGFRKGHIPLATLRQKYGTSAYGGQTVHNHYDNQVTQNFNVPAVTPYKAASETAHVLERMTRHL